MMQIGVGTTLPAHNLSRFHAKRVGSFNYRQSPLNPSKPSSATASCSSSATISISSTDYTKNHLSSLEKLLQKQSPESNARSDSVPKPNVPRSDGSRRASAANLVNRGKNLLEGLNLARIWPEMKAAEEMSPRHLNRLQRLLSKTAEYSPRNSLACRWREYHGSKDWEGMLDPLDENLRREVVRYGEFVQAAYHAFYL